MRPFHHEFESLGQYHDFWATVLLDAPDKFELAWLKEPIDQRQALVDSFDSLRTGLRFVRAKLKDERLLRILEELIEISFEAYSSGDRKRGSRALQECEGLIWPSRSIRLEVAAEAEQRVFGKVETFAHVKPRRFDGEGTIAELGDNQRALLDVAHARAMAHIQRQESFKPFVYVIDASGTVRELKQPSEKQTRAELTRMAKASEMSAFVRTEFVLFGVLIHDLEERGRAHVSARASVKDFVLEPYRFFLDDPSTFSAESDA